MENHMRLAFACLTLFPGAAVADNFTVNSVPSAVTVYADAGKVTREIKVQVPAGQHEILLPGLPRNIDPQFLRVGLSGAKLGTTQFRRDAVTPQPERDTAGITEAKERIKAAELALRDLDDQVTKAGLGIAAAQAKSKFLGDLGANQGLPTDVTSLRDLTKMIGSETLIAQQEALEAEQGARKLNGARPDLEQELRDARDALAALTPPSREAAQLTLALEAMEAGEITITMGYLVSASWQPVYDIHLDGDLLSIKRGAQVAQWSDENWQNVALTLSTFTLQQQTAPREVFPIPLTFGDKVVPSPKALSRAASADMGMAAVMEAPVMMEESVATASFDGPGVSYAVSAPVNVASNVDAVRVALDTLQYEPRRFARAVPRFDRTAFLMAEFQNDTKEPLLASQQASLYLDNTLVGTQYFEHVPAGAEIELPFGPIEDLRLEYTVLEQSEGDRGIISRSNARTETARMDIQNIGNDGWEVEVIAAVPYAVQEDLKIEWRASPAPASTNIDDKRGVLLWNSEIPAGKSAEIEIETTIEWPDGKVLR
jgi:uncharacterized protein (TIGR02231 family)